MPPQRYSMSGPFLAFAAAAKFGIRLSVDCSTVLILMLGCRASYLLTEVARNLDRPCASWLPQYHMVRVTGPLGAAELPPPELPPLLLLPQALAASMMSAAAAKRRPVVVSSLVMMNPPLDAGMEVNAIAFPASRAPGGARAMRSL